MSTFEPQPREVELHAYFDNELGPERIAIVQALIRADPEVARRVRDYRQQEDLMVRLFGPLLDRSVSQDLLAPLLEAASVGGGRQAGAWLRRALATFMLLTLGAASGWLARPLLDLHLSSTPAVLAEAQAAHQVYAGERRLTLDVLAGANGQLRFWLTDRLGFEPPLPDLGRFGLELMGGRLLPSSEGTAALLIFEDNAGQRVTLYMRPDATSRTGLAGVRIASLGGLHAAAWREAGAVFVMLGERSEEEVLQLAQSARATQGG